MIQSNLEVCPECETDDDEHFGWCELGHRYWERRAQELEKILKDNGLEIPPR